MMKRSPAELALDGALELRVVLGRAASLNRGGGSRRTEVTSTWKVLSGARRVKSRS